jgi:hypothetical protein
MLTDLATDPAPDRAEVERRRAAGMRRVRLERGWTMREAAERLEHDVSAVSRYEDGSRRPPPLRWLALCYDTTAEAIMADCPHCAYHPPAGYQCLRCGSANPVT